MIPPNYRIRALLEPVNGIRARVVESWASLLAMRATDEWIAREAKHRAADKIANSIVAGVLEGGTWSIENTPDGRQFTLYGYWLTYGQLCDLMQQAYNAGRTEPVALIAQITQQNEGTPP